MASGEVVIFGSRVLLFHRADLLPGGDFSRQRSLETQLRLSNYKCSVGVFMFLFWKTRYPAVSQLCCY
jgi:hypothetical protein